MSPASTAPPLGAGGILMNPVYGVGGSLDGGAGATLMWRPNPRWAVIKSPNPVYGVGGLSTPWVEAGFIPAGNPRGGEALAGTPGSATPGAQNPQMVQNEQAFLRLSSVHGPFGDGTF